MKFVSLDDAKRGLIPVADHTLIASIDIVECDGGTKSEERLT
jgi:hypothetical protein